MIVIEIKLLGTVKFELLTSSLGCVFSVNNIICLYIFFNATFNKVFFKIILELKVLLREFWIPRNEI